MQWFIQVALFDTVQYGEGVAIVLDPVMAMSWKDSRP